MTFTLIDAGGFLLAVVACGLLVVVPGWGLARLFDVARSPGGKVDPLMGVVVGLAILPLLDSLATRFLGLDAALALTLLGGLTSLVAVWPGRTARDAPWHPSRSALCMLILWLVVLGIEWIDIDAAGHLFQPLTAVDTVKHAATTQAILDSGAPPRDAFFLRAQPASYYYFFYTLAALALRLCAGLIDAKAAVGGMAFWVGIGVYGLVRLAIARAGLEIAGSASRLPKVVLAVLAASGIDIIAVVFIAVRFGFWHPDPVQWNEQVTGWLESLFWVPHHVTGLIAGTVGLVALAGCVTPLDATKTRPAMARAILLAALCFAAALGLSVWVTLTLVTTALVWGAILLVERQWRVFGALLVAGLLSIVLALPQLADLHAGRSNADGIPIMLTIRWFAPVQALVPQQPWNMIVRLVTLPLNYLIAFGALGIGSILFWRRRYWIGASEFGRVLTIAAIVGLMLGGFLRSTLLNNDLGWRVTEFAVLAATVWTSVVLDRRFAQPAETRRWTVGPALLAATLLVGYVTTAYLLFSVRAYEVLPLKPKLRYIASGGETERSLREAYGWANRNLPKHAVLQHDPARPRSFAFGLYSRHQVSLSDGFASLYGADTDAVETRMRALIPMFQTILPTAEIRATAAANGIDDLVVTIDDPIWAQPGSFVWRATPVYASDRVRIIPVAALKD
jgi:hypothetical protein